VFWRSFFIIRGWFVDEKISCFLTFIHMHGTFFKDILHIVVVWMCFVEHFWNIIILSVATRIFAMDIKKAINIRNIRN
jgi:hypothetical protein